MSEAHRAGVTPYVLRLAAYYAALGVGSYTPQGYAQFDRVEVRLAVPWTPVPDLTASQQVLTVEFWLGQRRVRWVDFSMVPSGFGGDPIVRPVSG